VDYVFGLARNDRLEKAIIPELICGLFVVRPNGEPDHGGCPGHEQPAQSFIAGSADAAQALLSAGRMFLRRQPDPGGQVTAGFERRRIYLGRQRQRDDHPDAGDSGQQLAERIGLVHRGQLHLEFGQPAIEVFDLLRSALASCVRWPIKVSRTFNTIAWACWATDFTGTKCIPGRPAASQIAAASLRSFLARFTKGFTYCGGINRTA
jgi:hypothetical protein